MAAPRRPSFKKLGVQFEPFILLNERGTKNLVEGLYHGSPEHFNEGDIIKPTSKKVAHATESWAEAYDFSHRTDEKSGQSVPGNVYVVYPVDTQDTEATWLRDMKYHRRGAQEVVSSKGFRVMKKAHPID